MIQTRISHAELQNEFPDQDACLAYLEKLKWENGFACPRCHHANYCKGNKPYNRQCTKCNHITSPTSKTLFHNLKFPLPKAFCIVYYVTTGNAEWASTLLSKKLELRQKTCWQFKQKVIESIKEKGSLPKQENPTFYDILHYHMPQA